MHCTALVLCIFVYFLLGLLRILYNLSAVLLILNWFPYVTFYIYNNI